MTKKCQLHLRFSLLFLLVIWALLFTSLSSAHLVANASKPDKLYWVEKAQERNLNHVRYFCKHANFKEVKEWHCQARHWVERELEETRQTILAISESVSISAWLPTYYCERGADGWATNTGNGYYGGLQFDHSTWVAHGGLRYAWNAHMASAYEQVLVASRVTYDAWPNCPNP